LPRPLRPQIKGGIYHVVSRGVRKLPLFHDDRDRERFLTLLEITRKRYGWQIHNYVLMGNHFHLLLTTPQPNISAGMQYLNGRYCGWFNWRWGYEGHVVERRFWSAVIESERHLFATARYIVLNPVRAGLCRRAKDWRWSSYRATVKTLAVIPRLSRWLLRQIARDLSAARETFAAFIREGEPDAPG
jgi:REP element-mobilizing transposase RayT